MHFPSVFPTTFCQVFRHFGDSPPPHPPCFMVAINTAHRDLSTVQVSDPHSEISGRFDMSKVFHPTWPAICLSKNTPPLKFVFFQGFITFGSRHHLVHPLNIWIDIYNPPKNPEKPTQKCIPGLGVCVAGGEGQPPPPPPNSCFR